MSEAYAYIMPQKTYANRGFYHSASIADLHPALEGTGARLRHIKIRTIEAVRSPATVKALQDSMAKTPLLGRGCCRWLHRLALANADPAIPASDHGQRHRDRP